MTNLTRFLLTISVVVLRAFLFRRLNISWVFLNIISNRSVVVNDVTQTDRFFVSFPRRWESIKVFSKLDSRFHGNDKVRYVVVK